MTTKMSAVAPPLATRPEPATVAVAVPSAAAVAARPLDPPPGDGFELDADGEPQPYEFAVIAELRDELRDNRARACARGRGEIAPDHEQDQRNAERQLRTLDVVEKHTREALNALKQADERWTTHREDWAREAAACLDVQAKRLMAKVAAAEAAARLNAETIAAQAEEIRRLRGELARAMRRAS